MEAKLRIRMSQANAHYAGNMVDGAKLLKLFGDVATELLIRHDGDEGLFRAYSSVEFLAPVYAGDFIEVTGKITRVGTTSRDMEFEAWKVITPTPDINETAAQVLNKPILVCKAQGTCVTPKDKQLTSASYNMDYTYGCSCTQILDATKTNAKGLYKNGCTKGILDDWHNTWY